MIAKKQTGSVLIASLWAVSIFSVFVSSVAFRSGQQAMLLKREIQDYESRADFLSAIHYFARLALEDAEPQDDSPLDAWYGEVLMPPPWEGKVKVEVSDEEARIDLNKASQKLLIELFEAVHERTGGLEGDAEDFSDVLLERRGEGKLLSIEELYLVEGVSRKDIEMLRPYVTVSTDFAGIQVNTSDPLVLSAFLRSLPGDERAKEEILRRLLDFRDVHVTRDRGVFASAELDPELFLGKLEMPATVQNVQIASQLVPFLTADSRTWRVEMTSSSGKTAQAIIQERAAGVDFTVLGWRES